LIDFSRSERFQAFVLQQHTSLSIESYF